MKPGELFEDKQGNVWRYDGPKGGKPTKQNITLVAERNMKPRAPELPKPSFMASVGRGMSDVVQGVEQLGRRAFGDAQETAAWEAQKNAEMQTYAQGQGGGFDPGRLVGNVAATAPLAAVPGGAAASTAVRAASGAAAGVAGAGSLYTDTSQGGFGEQKAVNTALGGAFGAGAGAASPWVSKAVAGLGKRGMNLFNRLRPSTVKSIEVQISNLARENGIDLSQVPAQYKARMLEEAMDAIDQTGTFDPAALARKANMERWGIKGTTGQITRDPIQWQFEREAAKQADVGDALRYKFASDNQKLTGIADDLANKISPDIDPADVGYNVRSVARDVAKKSQETVKAAYERGTQAFGQGQPIANYEGLMDDMAGIMVDFPDLVPPAILNKLDDLSTGKLSPTVQNVNDVIKAVNRQASVRSPAERKVLSEIGDALRGSLDETAQAGGEAAKQLREASAIAAKRFGLIRGSGRDTYKIVDDIIEGGRVDNLVNRMMSGNVDDLAGVRRFLLEFDDEAFPGIPKAQAQQAWDQVRGAVLRKVNDAAIGGNRDIGRFSGTMWRKAWNRLGETRQRLLFSDQEREMIQSAIQAASDLTAQPDLAFVNNSNTASALANLVNRLSSVPVLGGLSDMLLGFATIGKQATIQISKKRAADLAAQGRLFTEPQRLALASRLQRVAGAGPAAAAGTAGAAAANQSVNRPSQ